MIVLLLGSGGREHALAWKMSQSPRVEKIIALPGSDGIAALAKVECVAGNANDPAFVLSVAKKLRLSSPSPIGGGPGWGEAEPGVSHALRTSASNPPPMGEGATEVLAVIGPEQPLAAGVTDALEQAGFPVMGPSKAAARLENSKIFAKEFMTRQGIPTARFTVCDSHAEAEAALKAWDIEKKGVVLKADGLAAGKGVVVTHDRAEAEKTAYDFMLNPACSVKSEKILLEEKVTGKEVSAFALCDGETFLTLGYACDYKRVNDGDQGPNTGGMGGYAPEGWPSPAARAFIEENIFKKTVRGMEKEGTPFKGILFAGLMIDGESVNVIEYNTRFGDPETQILLPLIENDIVTLFEQAAKGNLSDAPVTFRKSSAVHVVMTSEGYPETLGTGMRLGEKITCGEKPLSLREKGWGEGDSAGCERTNPASSPSPAGRGGSNDALLFIAGAKKKNGAWVNDGGRVLGVTALGATIESARENAYAAIGKIHFNGAHWRKDIAR